MRKPPILLVLCFLFALPVAAQRFVLDSVLKVHPDLVNMEANVFKYADSSYYFKHFFRALDSVYEGKKEKVHIFHIGGSHVQADIYPNRLRTYLQSSSEFTMSQRGFVFPFLLANTNNPANYKVTSKTRWKGMRSSQKRDSIAWGLAGISAVFKDSIDTIRVVANHKSYTKKPYYFNKLRIFYNTWNTGYSIVPLDSSTIVNSRLDNEFHYLEYVFNDSKEEFEFQVIKTDSTTTEPFLMMGMELLNDEPGIEYTSIGVNGADFPSYFRSAFFEKQLRLYKPDMFIVSMGTNDTYMPESHFDVEKFKNNYESFILMIQRVNPECAILLAVPNDSYYLRKQPNPNTVKAEGVILELAEKYGMAVWDFYEIMGGFRSSQKWYQKRIMPRDRIHFTQRGYHIKSDLLLKAFVGAWEKASNREPGSLLKIILENAHE